MSDEKRTEDRSRELKELLSAYEEVYSELSTLKHIMFRATHLADLEELSLMFSNQIKEKITPAGNAIWLILADEKATEMVRDGSLLPIDERQVVEIDSSGPLAKLIHEQLVLWPPVSQEVQYLLPGFKAPVLFPLKDPSRALGFLALDQVGENKRDLCQWFAQFAAMMFSISILYCEVKEQHKELEEMTEILFKQQSHLAAVHQMGMDLMNMSEPESVYRTLLETAVSEFMAESAGLLLFEGDQAVLSRATSDGGYESDIRILRPAEPESVLNRCMETGRVMTQKDFSVNLSLGPHTLAHWHLFPLKGRETTHGILVVDALDLEAEDAIAIMLNQAGLVLDNLMATAG